MALIDTVYTFDKCVYWEPEENTPETRAKNRYGQRNFKDPVEIGCRWEGLTQIIEDANGEQKTSVATVYVGVDLKPGGILWHGLLVDVPDEPPGSGVILKFDKLPNKKATKFLRIAMV
jgi:hypothetical protein